MIAMTGRVTMLGLSRWTEKGGTFGRSVERFFYTAIPGALVLLITLWMAFQPDFKGFSESLTAVQAEG